jgi:carbon monoxide dehydrogenase subunit G
MKVEGTKVFDASRDAVWSVLMDPEQLASLLPGVDGFEIEDDAHWSAKVRVPLGMGGLKLGFAFEKVDEVPPERAALRAKGKGVGAIVSMETQFLLKEQGTGTAMDWSADVNVLGQVGSMGQRVLQPIVNQQVEGVLTALDQKVREAAGR